MEENIDNNLLSENESHENVLVRREQEVNKKLVQAELLMSRYKVIHNIGLLLISTNSIDIAKSKFLEYLSSSLKFQKILMLKTGENISIMGDSGYNSEQLKTISDSNITIDYLAGLFKTKSLYDSVFVESDDKGKELLGLESFLVGRVVSAEYTLYLIAGYDSENGSMYKYRYPLSNEDVSWFMQIVLLGNSFLERVKMFNQLNNKIKENDLLIQEKEKQVEERTRTLLEALFDAKKYKLALELADIMVILADTSSHKIIYANEMFEKISGYKRDIIISRKTLDFFTVSPLFGAINFFTDEFDYILKEGKSVHGMYIVETANGEEKQLDISTSKFVEDEGGSIYVIIARDVTDERSAQKREKEYAENIEKLNRLIVNRELRIIELKRKVAQSI